MTSVSRKKISKLVKFGDFRRNGSRRAVTEETGIVKRKIVDSSITMLDGTKSWDELKPIFGEFIKDVIDMSEGRQVMTIAVALE